MRISELCVFLQFKKKRFMKKSISAVVFSALLLTGCGNEFNRVYKTNDYSFKYEYAKECFAKGKYTRCSTLLQDLVTMQKGTDNAQESLYMLAMSEYCNRNYEGAAATFKKYYTSYPKGFYAEQAHFYVGQSLYKCTPEPRLDQSQTVNAIAAFQEFLDLYPDSHNKETAQGRMFELQDKLVQKELYSAQLYYDLGQYFGNCTYGDNNYEACIITAQNALKDYPYSALREKFAVLVMKSKYELAQQSVEEKKLERFQDAEDECYGFLNEYPDSKDKATAERFINKCKEFTKD